MVYKVSENIFNAHKREKMIRFLNDETVGGHRYGKGALAIFDAVTEAALILTSDAVNYPLPVLISQSYAPVTRSSNNSTDATYLTLASVTVPGGTMNANGKIVIEQDWGYTSSASTKNLRIDWGGQWMTAAPATTTARSCFMLAIKNANSLVSQTALNSTAFGSGAAITTAVDTTQDVTIDFRCNWSANVASEQITLIGYSIWYYPSK